ncbi:MAG: hypothetical protein WCG01_04065 [bacterium]
MKNIVLVVVFFVATVASAFATPNKPTNLRLLSISPRTDILTVDNFIVDALGNATATVSLQTKKNLSGAMFYVITDKTKLNMSTPTISVSSNAVKSMISTHLSANTTLKTIGISNPATKAIVEMFDSLGKEVTIISVIDTTPHNGKVGLADLKFTLQPGQTLVSIMTAQLCDNNGVMLVPQPQAIDVQLAR